MSGISNPSHTANNVIPQQPTGLSLSSIICALFYRWVECIRVEFIQPLRYELYKLLTPFDPFRSEQKSFSGKLKLTFIRESVNLITSS